MRIDKMIWERDPRPGSPELTNMPSRGYCIGYSLLIIAVTFVILGGLYMR